MSTQTRSLPFQRAAVAEETRTVSDVLATDSPIATRDPLALRGMIDEVLLADGWRADPPIPLLDDHSRRGITSILGAVHSIRTDGGRVLGALHVDDATAWRKIVSGAIRAVSVGYQYTRADFVEIPPGKSATVGGRLFRASIARPMRIVRQWDLREVSLTAIGADPAAKIATPARHLTPPYLSRSDDTMSTSLSTRSGPPVASARTLADGQLLRLGYHLAADRAYHGEPFAELRGERLVQRCLAVDRLDDPGDPVIAVRQAVSGGTLATIYSAAADAVLAQTWAETHDSTPWVRRVAKPNFRVQERHVHTRPETLDPIPRRGTAGHTSPATAVERGTVARFGKQTVLDEQDILDDRLGAFLETVAEMTRAAKRLELDAVYSELLSNPTLNDSLGLTLFHATRGNLASDAFADTALGTALAALSNQRATDSAGRSQPMNLTARYLVTPPDLDRAVRAVLHPLLLGDGRDLIALTEARLSADGVYDPLTGSHHVGAADHWYLFASPADCPTIELWFRRETPQLRQFVRDRGTWGFGFDVVHDVAAVAVAAAGAYRSAP